ncbi:transporter substrate-binding domain-containing protein [Moraxella oblonga]|uniref:transporter substrate-binding domain-containing protein n=1 Tax=Moraxella oblonga TaxID=200413 RepID=UPI00082C2E9C|nr:transporter substrate-binding domain-containing protein [Moraxella oblonga]
MNIKYLSVVLGTALLVACGGEKPADTPTNNTATQGETVIHIATESSFKPFSYLDNQGNTVGFEIDLANALCAEMKAKCDITSQEWDSLIPSLHAEKSDAIMAGMSVTPERQAVVDFTDSYFDNKLVIIGKKGETVTLDSLAGKTVGVQQSTLSADYLAKNQPKATVKPYDKQDNVYLDLSAGRIDYMMSDFVPVSDWLKTDAGANFEIKGSPIDIDDKVAIAIRKNDALKDKFNTALATIKSNGEYDKLMAKYFSQTASTETTPTQQTTN